MTKGLFVGRFQPVHKAHLEAIKRLLKDVNELVVVIGSAQFSHQLENPFTTGERITMLRLALEEEGVSLHRLYVIPVPDTPDTHSVWVAQVVAYSPKFDVVFSNDPLVKRLFREAGFEVRPIPFIERRKYSSSEVRRRMLKGENWEELVPHSVVDFIKRIRGVERLRELASSDKV
jgi:nicotinamide-nucleotide adenylyltransferase